MGKEFHDQYIYRHANGYVRVFRCCVWSPIRCNFMCFVIFSPMLHLKHFTCINQFYNKMLLLYLSSNVVLRSIRFS